MLDSRQETAVVIRKPGMRGTSKTCQAALSGTHQRLQIIVASLVFSTCLAAAAETITVKGSDTLVILAQKWADIYMRAHPKTKIQVTGGGSGTGFAALQNRTTDLATASRRIKAGESVACIKAFRRRPSEIKVCLDGLTIYVNRNNPVEALSLVDLEGIFTGKIINWQEIGGPDAPITVYGRENSSGTYEFFKTEVLQGKDYAATTQTMPGTAAVVQAIARDSYGIGYGGSAYSAQAKALAIRRHPGGPAIPPTEVEVRNQTYPIWRYLYVYVNPEKNRGATADFLNWIQSAGGQRLVSQMGYFPLREPKARTSRLTRNQRR